MTDIVETLIHELGRQAVLTGLEIGEKYSVDYTGDKTMHATSGNTA